MPDRFESFMPTVKGTHAPQRKVRFLPPGAFVSKQKMRELGDPRLPAGTPGCSWPAVRTRNIVTMRISRADRTGIHVRGVTRTQAAPRDGERLGLV
jgi:hypothetical protein